MTVRAPRETIGNTQAERFLLGLCLIEGSTLDEAMAALKPADFVLDSHQRTFSAMIALRSADAPVEPVALAGELDRRGDLDRVGGVGFVADLTDGSFSIDPTHYIELVRGYSYRRKVAAWAGRCELVALDPEATLEDLACAAEMPDDGGRAGRELMTFGDVAGARVDEVLRLADAAPGESAGCPTGPTGLLDLDRTTTGLRGGELWVVGAVPGAGKTGLLGQVAYSAIGNGVGVGVFSLEMSAAGMADRLMSLATGIHLRKLRVPRDLTAVDRAKLVDAREGLGGWPLVIDATPGLSLAVLRARARLMKRRQPDLGLILVDYLQLVHGPGEVRREQVASVARGLKDLARELDVAVLAASQLSRPPKGVEVKAPSMLDLKESGEIEAAADVVLLLHRPYVLTHRPSDIGEDRLIVAKNRHGVICDIDVVFDAGHCRLLPRAQGSFQ